MQIYNWSKRRPFSSRIPRGKHLIPGYSGMQVSGEQVDDTETRLKSINGLAQIVRAQRADVKADYVLGIGGFDLNRVADEVRAPL